MKFVTVLLILVACTFNLNAQILSGYGVKLGVGISNQSWSLNSQKIYVNFRSEVGVTARAFADMFKYSFLELEIEGGYLRKGFSEDVFATAEDSSSGSLSPVTNSLDYFSLTALAKININNDQLSSYIIAGPQLNFLVGKHIEAAPATVFRSFRKTNIGYSIGAGFEMGKLLTGLLFLEYRFERDFKNNFNKNELVIKNYSHVLMLGLKF